MRTSTLLLGLFLSCGLNGQVNLVPNPSFETIDSCPAFPGLLFLAQPWFQPNGNGSNQWCSSDLYSECDTGLYVDLPSNWVMYQFARSGQNCAGIGYVGYLTTNNNQEYAEVQLTDSMIPNRNYCVSYYVVLIENSGAGISNLGVRFTDDSLYYTSASYDCICAGSQLVYQGNPIIDTANWTLVQGVMTASGGERFMTMGNFQIDTLLIYTCVDASCDGVYYLIDDVSVILLPDLDAGLNDTLCSADSTILTATISETWPGMSFEWLPHTGLNNPYSLSTTASPNTTTTYTLTVSCATCDVPCLSDIPDSVTITVLPQVNVPFDDTLCLGDSLLLTGIISEQWAGMQYEWFPHTGLSDPFSLSTFASPAVATTYTLTATCPSCGFTTCATLRDSIYLAVKMDCDPMFNEMIVPTLVGSNQRWEIMFLQPNTHVKIYDERGRIIFETENYQNSWTAEISGAMYFYEITLSDGSVSNGKMVVK